MSCLAVRRISVPQASSAKSAVRKSASISSAPAVRTLAEVMTPALLTRSVTSFAFFAAAAICSGLVVSSVSGTTRGSPPEIFFSSRAAA